ncbi:MAG: HAD family hydrolase [Desulfovibrio sp.]|nr:HAD family hydrolase [Desulfovibrio sp.]
MGKACIFDLDGTILNTLDDLGNACNCALAHFGYPTHDLKAYEQMVGNGFLVLVIRSLPEGEHERLSPKDFDAIVAYAKASYAHNMCVYTKPYEGLPEALHSLHSQNIALCVLSNKPEPMTQTLVATYFSDLPFARVYGGRDDYPLKPDPSRLLIMLDEIGVQAKDCLFIGDSNVDMMTAHAAHVPAIGVAWGFRGATELLKYGASKLLTHPKELADLFLEL